MPQNQKIRRNIGRRVLSALLLLAMLCGMFPALPVFASPGVSAKVNYIESGRMPTEDGYYETAVADNRWNASHQECSITYRGNWLAGCVSDGKGFSVFTYVNSSNAQWLTLDTTDQWSSPAGTVSATAYDIRPHGTAGYATGLAYRAEFTGTVRFSVDAISGGANGATDGFAIFVGDKMIWPKPGTSVGAVNDMTGWYPITAATTATEINNALSALTYGATAGQDIAFVFKHGDGGGYCRVDPRVVYVSSSVTEGSKSTVAFRNENFPTYQGAVLTSNFKDNWGFGSFPRDNPDDFTLFDNMSDSYFILNRGKDNDDDQWHYGGLYLETGKVIMTGNYVSVFNYCAPFAGEVNIAVEHITAGIGGDGTDDILFCIAINGKMVWPTTNGQLKDPGEFEDWFALLYDGDVSAATHYKNAGALLGVDVKVGDNIQYCFATRSGHSMNVKDVTLSVTYANVVSTVPTTNEASSSLADNFPLLDGAESGSATAVGTYRGRWNYVYASRESLDFTELRVITDGRLLGGGTVGEGYISPLHNNQPVAGLAPGYAFDVAVGYTVRLTGKVKLSVAASAVGEVGTVNYRVLLNGEEIGGVSHASVAGISETVVEANVIAGDEIYFVLSSVAGEPAKENAFFNLLPAVEYTEVANETAIVGASMTVSSNLTVNFYVGANGLFADMDEYGILIWREAQEDYTAAERRAERITEGVRQSDFRMRITYHGVAAKQMTDIFYVRPYIVKDGKKHYGDVVKFSVIDYVMQLYGRSDKLDTLLTDMLLYGEAAQEYFGYHTDRLPTARLTSAQRDAASKTAYLYVDRRSVGAENQKNPAFSRIESFSLSLEDRITFCAHIALDESELGTAVLEVSKNYNMSDFSEYAVDENGRAKAVALHAAEVGRIYYFRLRTVRDGMTCYGPIISYNIESYASGLAAAGHSDMAKLCAAMINYGYSALAYATSLEEK